MDNENNNIETYDDPGSSVAATGSTIYHGSNQIPVMYLGENKIIAIYKGDTLIYSV